MEERLVYAARHWHLVMLGGMCRFLVEFNDVPSIWG